MHPCGAVGNVDDITQGCHNHPGRAIRKRRRVRPHGVVRDIDGVNEGYLSPPGRAVHDVDCNHKYRLIQPCGAGNNVYDVTEGSLLSPGDAIRDVDCIHKYHSFCNAVPMDSWCFGPRCSNATAALELLSLSAFAAGRVLVATGVSDLGVSESQRLSNCL